MQKLAVNCTTQLEGTTQFMQNSSSAYYVPSVGLLFVIGKEKQKSFNVNYRRRVTGNANVFGTMKEMMEIPTVNTEFSTTARSTEVFPAG